MSFFILFDLFPKVWMNEHSSEGNLGSFATRIYQWSRLSAHVNQRVGNYLSPGMSTAILVAVYLYDHKQTD